MSIYYNKFYYNVAGVKTVTHLRLALVSVFIAGWYSNLFIIFITFMPHYTAIDD
jgi:hypothetical protein